MKCRSNLGLALATTALFSSICIALAADPSLKSESFDHDPHWDSHNNHVAPAHIPTIVQDFGYSDTNVAGKSAGELGGQITRASEPAFYADRIGPKTLNDKLAAAGTFAIRKTSSGAGLFFGFFKAEQAGATGRPICSLGMDIDCERGGARLAVRLITGAEKSCGTFVTPFIPGKFRPTPIRNDGTRYRWTLDYNPNANNQRGRFTFTIHSDANPPDELLKPDLPENHRQEALGHFPHTTSFTVDLPEGFKQQQTVFDHFGLMNGLKPGGSVKIYFDDLQYCGKAEDFSRDPHWDSSQNRLTYQATDVAGAHDFGFSNTSFAGGQPGEIGGTFWRTEGNWGYYADKVGPLTLRDRLEARGKVQMTAAGPDADMCVGWFAGKDNPQPPDKAGNFLGIHVGGPTRRGHPFVPAFCFSANLRGISKDGPSLRPGKTYDWSLLYDPNANHGDGAITAVLGSESVTFDLKKGQKQLAQDAKFDHFGMFSTSPGGQMVKIYLDDVRYTAAADSK
jgi:hypothetical protein